MPYTSEEGLVLVCGHISSLGKVLITLPQLACPSHLIAEIHSAIPEEELAKHGDFC